MTRDPSSLLAAAVAARRGAYAPYSNFTVGAALATRDGRIFTGANIENASYGLSMCAERVAIFHAVAAGARQFDAIAVAGPDGAHTVPCGACRQVLWEFAHHLQVVIAESGSAKVCSLQQLLPDAFGAEALGGHPLHAEHAH